MLSPKCISTLNCVKYIQKFITINSSLCHDVPPCCCLLMAGVSLSWPTIRPIQHDPDIFSKYYLSETGFHIVSRAVTRVLIGGGGVWWPIVLIVNLLQIKKTLNKKELKYIFY